MDYFVYYYKDGKYFYDRTCGLEGAAITRVNELQARHGRAVYLINHTIKGAFV